MLFYIQFRFDLHWSIFPTDEDSLQLDDKSNPSDDDTFDEFDDEDDQKNPKNGASEKMDQDDSDENMLTSDDSD